MSEYILQPNSKEDVDYRQHESCGTCANYNGRGACAQVKGNISPSAVCRLWTLIAEVSTKTNKEYFETAYKKEEENGA